MNGRSYRLAQARARKAGYTLLEKCHARVRPARAGYALPEVSCVRYKCPDFTAPPGLDLLRRRQKAINRNAKGLIIADQPLSS